MRNQPIVLTATPPPPHHFLYKKNKTRLRTNIQFEFIILLTKYKLNNLLGNSIFFLCKKSIKHNR